MAKTDNDNVLCAVFFQIGAHSPLQSKEPKRSKTDFTHIHARRQAGKQAGTQAHMQAQSVGRLEEARFQRWFERREFVS